jgi:hypothetical protein
MYQLTVDMVSVVESKLGDMEKLWKDYIEEGNNVRPLLQSTIKSKEKGGSLTPDIPLIEYGDMIMSIGSEVIQISDDTVRGSLYGTDPKWIYHEYGLGVPERSTLRPVWDTNIDAKVDEILNDIFEQHKEEFIRS